MTAWRALEAAKSPLLHTAQIAVAPTHPELSLSLSFLASPVAPPLRARTSSSWLWADELALLIRPGQSRRCAPSQQASSTGSKRSGGHPAHHRRPPLHRDTNIVVSARPSSLHRASPARCDCRPSGPLGASLVRTRPDPDTPVATPFHGTLVTSAPAPRCTSDIAYISTVARTSPPSTPRARA